jgi:hypothetical protein
MAAFGHKQTEGIMAKYRRQLLDYLRNYWLVSAIQDGLLGAIQAKDVSPVFGDIDIVQSIVSATEVEGQGPYMAHSDDELIEFHNG